MHVIAMLSTRNFWCWLSCTHAAAICKEGETQTCFNCMFLGTCTKAGDPVTGGMRCPTGQLCTIVNGIGMCKPSKETSCNCTPFTVGCDLYDPLGVTMCISLDSPAVHYSPFIMQSCAPNQLCAGGKCATPVIKPTKCTATNVNNRYPIPDECKKHTTCREVKSGVYNYVNSTCPSTLVFNPANNFCDLSTTVPTCK